MIFISAFILPFFSPKFSGKAILFVDALTVKETFGQQYQNRCWHQQKDALVGDFGVGITHERLLSNSYLWTKKKNSLDDNSISK